MSDKISPAYLRDLALWVRRQAATDEMREVGLALETAAEEIEDEVASRNSLLVEIASLKCRQ